MQAACGNGGGTDLLTFDLQGVSVSVSEASVGRGPRDVNVEAVPAQCWSRVCSHHGEETQGLADQSQVGFPVVQFASKSFLVLGDADRPLRPVSRTDKGL